MTLLQKITYLADYIEPWRNKATNLPVIREVAFQDLDKACRNRFDNTAGI